MYFSAGPFRAFSEHTVLSLLLYQFLHGSIMHLFANVMMVLFLGPIFERLAGRFALPFYIATTVGVFLALWLFSSGSTIGMSGTAMAVIGYCLVRYARARNPEWQAMFFFLIINTLLGLMPGVSLVGHASGAIIGAILGMVHVWFADIDSRRHGRG
jgi:rhomboid protease GluP